MFFFNLKQSPYKDKDPVICQDTQKLIYEYKRIMNSGIPVWFDETIDKINEDFYNNIIKYISKTSHENVCWRFKKIEKNELDLYRYSKQKGSFIFYKKMN